MKLAVFGASGKVGRLAVKEALARGHQVNALVHNGSHLPNQPDLLHQESLTVYRGDARQLDDVLAVLQGCGAVISALGSWGTKSKDVVTGGIAVIIPAMEQAGIERIVSLTGAEAIDAADRPAWPRRLTHGAAKLLAPKILADGEQHIGLLRDSQLDWTVLRSPVMTGGPETFYRLSLQAMLPWQTIPRAAVAKALVDQAEGPAYSRAAPFVYRQASRF